MLFGNSLSEREFAHLKNVANFIKLQQRWTKVPQKHETQRHTVNQWLAFSKIFSAVLEMCDWAAAQKIRNGNCSSRFRPGTSYLLLNNKISLKLGESETINIYFFSHSLWVRILGVTEVGGYHLGCLLRVSGGCSIERLGRGWDDSLRRQQASLRANDPRNTGQSHNVFNDLTLEVTHHLPKLHSVSPWHQTGLRVGGAHTQNKYHGVRSLGASCALQSQYHAAIFLHSYLNTPVICTMMHYIFDCDVIERD